MRSITCSVLLVLTVGASYAGESAEGSRRSHSIRFEPAPGVQRILDAGGPHARMAADYIKYATDLVDDIDALDKSVAKDVQLHDLEPQGFKGLAGLKEFRRQRNAAFQYDRAVITAMRFPAPEIIEADVCTERTDTATGNKRVVVIYAKNRWVNDQLLERWDSIKELPAGSGC